MTSSINLVERILTPRLVLRIPQIDDAEQVQGLLARNKEQMIPWVPWAGDEPESVEAKRQKIRKWRGEFYLDQTYRYGVFDNSGKDLLGIVFLFTRQGNDILEIGYIIDSSQSGQGYATEASYALTKVGFEAIGIQKMVIHCSPENEASQRIPKKLSYALEGVYRSARTEAGRDREETMIWALFKEEFSLLEKFEPVEFFPGKGWS